MEGTSESVGSAALAPEGQTLTALDFTANRATALSEALRDYRILHFAAHGLLNSQRPELSGIVLSLVDEHDQPQNGFLRLHDIYNLKLGADLVALSACQTALGKEIKGEGLVGLTRGFMYAGAARVLASLWKVEDEATAELMKRFYEGMLGQGLSPAAALRAAQVAMWQGKKRLGEIHSTGPALCCKGNGSLRRDVVLIANHQKQRKYVFSVEDAAGSSHVRERVEGVKKKPASVGDAAPWGVGSPSLPFFRSANPWLTPAALASRLGEPAITDAKHISTKEPRFTSSHDSAVIPHWFPASRQKINDQQENPTESRPFFLLQSSPTRGNLKLSRV